MRFDQNPLRAGVLYLCYAAQFLAIGYFLIVMGVSLELRRHSVMGIWEALTSEGLYCFVLFTIGRAGAWLARHWVK